MYYHRGTCDESAAAGGDKHMNWAETKSGIAVAARPTGTWTLGVEYVKAVGKWAYGAGKECGPDGDLNALLSADQALLPGAPVGALIVKIGGSTAGAKDGTLHVAGSSALVALDANTFGPVYLTINDHATGLADNTGEVKVTISIAPQPAAPPVSDKEGGKPAA
jgi:hypothetical protein